MESKTLWDSLSPEELEVEYTVRGMSSTQVGVEKKLLESIQKECQNSSLKPKISHITANPEVELDNISQQSIELDKALDLAENSPHSEKRKLLVRILHWRDRAQRLINSFPNLQGTSIIINSLERLSRYINRDLKKVESVSETQKKGAVPKPSTSKVTENNDSGGGKKSIEDEQPGSEIEIILERRFSKKLDEMSKVFMDQLAGIISNQDLKIICTGVNRKHSENLTQLTKTIATRMRIQEFSDEIIIPHFHLIINSENV